MKSNCFTELYSSILNWRIWLYYSIQDIKNKYSRSVLGPFWITLSMAVTIFAMGPLYGIMFSQGDNYFILYLSTGLVFWAFISGVISESSTAFIANETFIKQTVLPKYIYVFRIISRNLIILFHNILIPLIVSLYFGKLTTTVFLLIPVLVLVTIFLFFISVTLGFFCSRYRDLIPLVNNFVQLAMFVTPVFWIHPDPFKSYFLKFNIFFYLLSILRAPFYGEFIDMSFIYIVLFSLLCAACISLYVYEKYYRKLVYWL